FLGDCNYCLLSHFFEYMAFLLSFEGYMLVIFYKRLKYFHDFSSAFFLAFKCPVPLCFVQIHSYLSIFKLLTPKTLSKGVCAVKTIAPLSFITLLYCCHNSSKGMIASHLFRVVPYSQGRSHNIISIDLSGICCINSKQSP